MFVLCFRLVTEVREKDTRIIPSPKVQTVGKTLCFAKSLCAARNNPAVGMMPQIVNPRRSPAMIQDAGATTDAIPVGDQGRGAERPARLVSPTIPEERRRGFHGQVSATTLGQILAEFPADRGRKRHPPRLVKLGLMDPQNALADIQVCQPQPEQLTPAQPAAI